MVKCLKAIKNLILAETTSFLFTKKGFVIPVKFNDTIKMYTTLVEYIYFKLGMSFNISYKMHYVSLNSML